MRLGDLGWSADHLWPQTAFLPDTNRERLFGVRRANADPLSFIGSVGRLDEDFERLRELLGLPAAPLPWRRASGTEAGAERMRRYAARYDGPARRVVEELYAADLEFTGWGFDHGRTAVAVTGRRDGAPRRRDVPPPWRRPLRTLPARARRWLWSLEAAVGERILRAPGVWRAVRPLALRRGPG